MADRDAKIRITASDETRGAFNSVAAGLGNLEQKAQSVTGRIGAMRGAFAGIAGVVGAGLFTGLVTQLANTADELGKTAAKTGTTVEGLSALKYAADLSDVSFEQLTTGLKKLSVNMADTQRGTGEAKDAFKALGIEVTDSAGKLKTSDQVLAEVATKFKGMEDGAGKTALAIKLFGRAGADLIPLLNEGAEGLEAMKKEAERLGIIIDTKTAAAAQRLNDNLTRLGATFEGLKAKISGPFVLALADITDHFLAASRAGLTFWQTIKEGAGFGANPFELQAEKMRLLRREAEILAATGGNAESPSFLEAMGIADPSELERVRARLAEINKELEAQERFRREIGRTLQGPSAPKSAAPALPDDDKPRKARKERVKKDADDTALVLRQLTEAAEQEAQDFADAWKFAQQPLVDLRKFVDDLLARSPGGKTQAFLGDIDKLNKAFFEDGIIGAEEYDRALEVLTGSTKELKEATEEASDVARDLGLTFSSAVEDFLSGKGGDLRDFLKAVEQDILRIGTRKLVTEPLAGAATDLLKDFDFGKIFAGLAGFQHGGSFTVGGAGGTDSQLVAFRATPGERVDIAPPGGRRGGVMWAPVFHINVPQGTSRASAGQIGLEAGLALQRFVARNG